MSDQFVWFCIKTRERSPVFARYIVLVTFGFSLETCGSVLVRKVITGH